MSETKGVNGDAKMKYGQYSISFLYTPRHYILPWPSILFFSASPLLAIFGQVAMPVVSFELRNLM